MTPAVMRFSMGGSRVVERIIFKPSIATHSEVQLAKKIFKQQIFARVAQKRVRL